MAATVDVPPSLAASLDFQSSQLSGTFAQGEQRKTNTRGVGVPGLLVL